MIRLTLALVLAAAAVSGCATRCERDTPNFGQPTNEGIARAQEGCRVVDSRPVQTAQVQAERTPT